MRSALLSIPLPWALYTVCETAPPRVPKWCPVVRCRGEKLLGWGPGERIPHPPAEARWTESDLTALAGSRRWEPRRGEGAGKTVLPLVTKCMEVTCKGKQSTNTGSEFHVLCQEKAGERDKQLKRTWCVLVSRYAVTLTYTVGLCPVHRREG